ncbi:MAG: N-acetyltransferase [Chromatiales bacterium]|nr:N-acetyltransferase [Chromatiales bacterium]
MKIRIAGGNDRDSIEAVHSSAFPESERGLVSRLAVALLSLDSTPQSISLLAEVDGAVVGHIAFSPVLAEGREHFLGYILAPLGVVPNCQGNAIGTKLVEHGLTRLSAMAVNRVFVYGDPKYYGRFGFSADAASLYAPPYELQYPFGWQALALNGYEPETTPVALSCAKPLQNPELW